MVCLARLPSSLFDLHCTDIFQNLLFAVAVLTAITAGVRWVWKNVYYKHGNFQLSFFSSLPPQDNDIGPLDGIKEISLWENQLFVRIRSAHAFPLSEINFRCINEDKTNVSLDIVVLKSLQDIYRDLSEIKKDDRGGIEGTYKSGVVVTAGGCQYFNIGLYAKQKWSGHLSFRARDKQGFEAYALHKLRIVPTTAQQQLVADGKARDDSAASEFISMKEAAINLYTESRGKAHQLAAIAESMSGWKSGRLTDGSPEDILNYMATYIAFCKKIAVRGKRVPSTATEQISWDDVRASRFVDGATKLEHIYNNSIYFTDLAIKSDDLNDLIAQLQFDEGFREANS